MPRLSLVLSDDLHETAGILPLLGDPTWIRYKKARQNLCGLPAKALAIWTNLFALSDGHGP